MTTKALYIKIFQPFAQYRNPFTFYYAQTYPLPPKSTIIGMLQNLIDDYYGHKHGVENWWKLKVSIHGGFESVFWNYQQLIKGEIQLKKVGNKLVLSNQNLPLYNEGIKSQRTPVHQQELFNGHLHIFIKGERSILKEVKEAFDNPRKILSLGRSEDIIFIRRTEFVEPINGDSKTAEKSIWLSYPTYIKRDSFPIKNEKYPVYSIPVKIVFKNKGIPAKNKAEISKNTEREVEFKTVIYTGFDYVIKLNKPIKFEEFHVNGQSFKIISDGWL